MICQASYGRLLLLHALAAGLAVGCSSSKNWSGGGAGNGDAGLGGVSAAGGSIDPVGGQSDAGLGGTSAGGGSVGTGGAGSADAGLGGTSAVGGTTVVASSVGSGGAGSGGAGLGGSSVAGGATRTGGTAIGGTSALGSGGSASGGRGGTNTGGSATGGSTTGTPHMQIGVNFWNIGWEGWQSYFKSGVDWSSETNPWNPQLLADLAKVNGPLRFMDFDEANSNLIVEWKDRIQPTENQYDAATKGHSYPIASSVEPYASGKTGTATHNGIAYEWMIDLCNRSGRDMWINVPTFSNADYWTQLATLINTKLDPKLKVYLEYSNETWNFISVARDYSMAMGAAAGIPDAPHDVVSPTPSKWYLGPAWCMWQSLNVFKAFVDVFGADNTGIDKRLVRVFAFSENADRTARIPIGNVVFNGAPEGSEKPDLTLNAKWNPNKMVPDMLAIAPYVGPSDVNDKEIDGAASDAQEKFHADIVKAMTGAWAEYRAIGKLYGIPMGTYEGGNQLSKNADKFNLNPGIYDEYTFFLDQIDTLGLVMFTHYTMYGAYGSGSAWGLKQSASTADTMAASPKWQAVKDWLAAHK